jgi:redox-sensitive bicupin YhaK (pirin superfamily)
MAKHFRKIPASDLHYLPASQMHPANTYFHFSFANYHNPNNMNFGVLRVLNDDDVKPHDGFGQHPHRDMEIVSYIVKGELTHWDNATDAPETLGRGNVQIVTAGTGVWHSELNKHDGWTRFLQIWILPPKYDLPVRYENHDFQPEQRDNKLLHIVGNLSNKDQVPLHLNQDVNLYVSELTDSNAKVTFQLNEGRQVYINNIEGSVTVNEDTRLDERDSLEVIGPAELVFTLAGSTAHFILIEMAERHD